MKPLARNHSERGIYDCSKGPPPPYTTSKSIPDESAVASRALVHPTPPHTQYATGTKPATVAFQAFNQMIGTVQPTAQAQVYKAQVYKPLQVHSSNEASLQTQNTFVYKTISQPMCQTIPAPGRKQITLQHKGSAVTNKEVQRLALNGVAWMTTAGQMAQTVNNVHGVHPARMMQSYNPVVQNHNVGQSSKTLISIAPTSGSVPQISEGQGQLNVLDSQGNRNSALNLTANDFLRCNDQIQIQSAFRKEDAFQDQSKVPSTVAGATPAQVFHRIWPAPTNYASVPAHVYGERARGDSSEWAGSSVSLSSQQNGQHNITNCFSLPNSNGQKRMVLARVTPMSHDWRNLQQNSNTFSTMDVNKLKNSQVEDAQLHHKLGSGQQSSAVSTSEKLFEKKNTTSSQLSAPRISVQRNIPIAPFVHPLPHKPSLHRQQSVQNIHFIYPPATVNEQCTVTSPMSSLSLKAQHNVTGPGSDFSISNISSKDPLASQVSPLSAGHGNFGVSSNSSDMVTQQTVTVSSVGAESLRPNGDQNVLPPSDVPHSTNMLCSTFREESKDEGKQSVDMVFSGSNPPPLGFNNENSKSSSVQLSSRDDCGKQSTAGLLLVVPPSVVMHNCQTMESSTVYTPPSTLTYEKDIPVKLIGGQVETSNTVVEMPTSMLEVSKYLASSDANLSGSAGQHREDMLGHGSSTVGECSQQQKNCANHHQYSLGSLHPESCLHLLN
ncbi:uncharacterized protein LOC127578637 isoform X1 [Pristis pectinata]|uniref:uncharacterized protein LOC127578637 isoform X1 n=1 Tax=Pristis pectinata TaxID=685728 RepID=UPI00223DEEB9|nr:uncharacterized protein LOC127578637 isoform X1 [Pristis pectinata]XP_051886792.1 uncharacterized protein LOC127578637 isoform X1 [Pristis pectinata]XP_051886793.1 uncharacterized protein LOC127578637 isoform X1 [Pristis pectinata]XP_051886794.1 uncharacterized protein LOC127578637 isoform X1 [Pristis pectinata]